MITMGQLVFYSGVGLLILTIILVCFFWAKKPQYIPGTAAYDGMGDSKTRKIRSGYPTERLSVRKEEKRVVTPETVVIQGETERLNDERPKLTCDTEALPDAGGKKNQETERLLCGTRHLATGTELLDAVTAGPLPATERLLETVSLTEQQSERLDTRTTLLSETTELLDDWNPSR